VKQLLVTHCAGKDLRVGKQKYSKEFKQAAVERMRSCGHIVALAAELGVARRQLYRWRDELDPEESAIDVLGPKEARTSTLRKEVNHLKRVLAEKTLEVDFFKSIIVPPTISGLTLPEAPALARASRKRFATVVR
jgi:transposase-like protein